MRKVLLNEKNRIKLVIRFVTHFILKTIINGKIKLTKLTRKVNPLLDSLDWVFPSKFIDEISIKHKIAIPLPKISGSIIKGIFILFESP